MTRAPPAHVFLTRQLRDLSATLAETLPRVRKRSDAEAIHDMRVALRRLRVVLKIARPLFGRFYVDAIRAAFTRVHRVSGALRDEEVLRETLDDLGVEAPELDAWIAHRASREESLRRMVESRLRAGDLRRPLKLLDALLALPVPPKRRRMLSVFARKVTAIAQRDVEARRSANTSDGVALHELRIAFKRVRYTTEIFATALSPELAALTGPAARFQKRLGEIHDLDVAHHVILRARNLNDVVRARTIAAISHRRAAKVEAYAAELRA